MGKRSHPSSLVINIASPQADDDDDHDDAEVRLIGSVGEWLVNPYSSPGVCDDSKTYFSL